jgi:putative cell wall-binding protein
VQIRTARGASRWFIGLKWPREGHVMSVSGLLRSLVSPRVGLAVLVAVALAVPLGLFGASDASAWVSPMVFRVSENESGVQVNDIAYTSAISADGATLAFESKATNMVPEDLGVDEDIYVVEPFTGDVELISVSPTGSVGNEVSSNAFVSADGRFVVFSSFASNIVPPDTNVDWDLFIRDRMTDTTKRVTLGPGSVEPTAGTYYGQCTANGKFVAFTSTAISLVPGVVEGGQVYIRDMDAGINELVSVAPGGGSGNESAGTRISMTPNGRYVAFTTNSTNLDSPPQTGFMSDAYVRDRVAGTTTRVTRTHTGALPTGHSSDVQISANGRYVVFEYEDDDLLAADSNTYRDIFRYDRSTGKTEIVSVQQGGGQGNNHSRSPRGISADGRHVYFTSTASNLRDDVDPGSDTNNDTDTYAKDMVTGEVTRVSLTDSLGQITGDSDWGDMSADGRNFVFDSFGTNVVTPDTNGDTDVFFNRRSLKETKRLASADRYTTAVDIATEAFDLAASGTWAGVSDIVIASGEDRAAADPLSAAGLCWAHDAPLFLVTTDKVPVKVKQKVAQIAEQNGTVTVHIVGGPVSVPDARFNELKAYVEQYSSGTLAKDRLRTTGDRYDMAATVAQRVKTANGGVTPDIVLVANGANPDKFFDALALSPIAASEGFPILLVEYDKIPSATRQTINSFAGTGVIVGGGPATVSDGVRSQLGADRWAGDSRYTTAIAIADRAVGEGWLMRDTVGVAAKLPDALTGGATLGQARGCLLITQSDKLQANTGAWLGAHKNEVNACYVFGGVKSVTPAVMSSIDAKLK